MSVYYDTVKLVKAGSVVGDDKASSANTITTSDAFTTFGGKDELWGTTWTPAQVNATDFGCVISIASSGWGTDYTTHYLKVTDFDFAVPTSSTISGVKVEVEGKYTDGVSPTVSIDRVRMFVYYDAPEYTDVTSVENLLVAVARGNTTEVTDTTKMAIVDFSSDELDNGYIFTSGEDFGSPEADKIIRAIEIRTSKPLADGETITFYSSVDNTNNDSLESLTWTSRAVFAYGEDDKPKAFTPFTCKEVRWKILLDPLGTSTSTPGLVGYSILYEPVGPFKETYKSK